MKTDDSSTRFSLRRPQDGAVLVVVLLAMVGLLGMGLAGLYLTSGNIQMSSNINMRNQALYVAEGGIQVARGILNRPNSDLNWPNLSGMLSGTTGPSGATVATPSGFTDELPGRPGTDASDYGCSGKSNGVSTRGAYLRDDDPPPLGFGCQTSASTTGQPVYVDCNYPPTYSYTDSNGNSISYNATPPDPNGMSATPTQYMGKYTLFIRQDMGECRRGYITEDSNGIVVIRSEGTASDNRTKVVLEVTMSTNPNVAILSQAIATVCPAGAAGCDDNSSVQQGITVGPPGSGGVTGSGGAGGTGGAAACTTDCTKIGEICCSGICVDATTDTQNCGGCGTKCASDSSVPPVCCNSQCCNDPRRPFCCNRSCSPAAAIENTALHCGICGAPCKSGEICCSGAGGYACQQPAPVQDKDASCGACGTACVSPQVCCSDGAGGYACKSPAATQNLTTSCGVCGTTCGSGQVCCNGGCTSGICCPPSSTCNNIALLGVFGPWGSECTQSGSKCVSNTGASGFNAWLKTHNSACSKVDTLAMVNDPTSSNNWSKQLSQYQILIVLDIFHSQADINKLITNPATGNTCKTNTAPCSVWWDSLGTTSTLPRGIDPREVTDLQNWVKNGGGLVTTIGYTQTANEYTNVNKLLHPFNVYYTNYNSNYEFLLDVQNKSCWITGGASKCAWQWITNGYLSMANVSNLRVDNGAPIMTLGSGPVLFAQAKPSSNYYHTGNNGAGMAVDGNVGMIVDTPSLTDKGRVVVWSDEWVTYNHDWNAMPAQGCSAEADTSTPYWDATLNSCTQRFWNNIIAWLRPSCP